MKEDDFIKNGYQGMIEGGGQQEETSELSKSTLNEYWQKRWAGKGLIVLRGSV